MLDLMEY